MDCEQGLARIKDGAASCVIADPPYYKVLGTEWDYRWRCEEDYIQWCEKWMTQAHRVLRANGHFWLWGYYNILARCHSSILKIGFKHRQTIIWDKGIQAVAGRKTSTYKQYPNVTEYCVGFVKWSRDDIRVLLLNRQKEMKVSNKEMNEALGVKTNGGGMWSIYTANNVCEQIPTEEAWEAICRILQLEVPYSAIGQIWETIPGITNVWSDIPPVKGKYRINPAQKPNEAIRRLVMPTTRPNDLVIDLFAGSMGVYEICETNNRRCISIEQNEVQVDSAIRVRRLKNIAKVVVRKESIE
jgi:site-specific DNA-methyltransferase (adenine-specific)